MKALIKDNTVLQIEEVEFEVHSDFTWVDCDDTVQSGDSYNGVSFTSNQTTQEEIDAAIAAKEAKVAARASGNQKLLDLGLTQAEATALTGYVPPSE